MLLERFFVVVAGVSLVTATFAQVPAPSQRTAPFNSFGLQDSTPDKLRISRTISSAESRTGEQVDFEVLEEVRVNEKLVIAKGGTAMATITEAQSLASD